MRSRGRPRLKHSDCTSATHQDAKSRDRKRKRMRRAPLKRKRASRTKQAFVLDGVSCSDVDDGGSMTDVFVPVLVPYTRFLDVRARRLEIVTELTQPDEQPTIDLAVSS